MDGPTFHTSSPISTGRGGLRWCLCVRAAGLRVHRTWTARLWAPRVRPRQ